MPWFCTTRPHKTVSAHRAHVVATEETSIQRARSDIHCTQEVAWLSIHGQACRIALCALLTIQRSAAASEAARALNTIQHPSPALH